MTNVNFCTPVSFGHQAQTLSQTFLEFADDYFFFGGDKAVVQFGYVEGESLGVELVHAESSWVSTALKVISYFTIILPTVLLIAKCILRSIHQFHLLPPLVNGLVLKRHEHLVAVQILETGYFPKVLAELIASYVTSDVDCFGAQEWLRYFRADVVEPEKELNPVEFYNFWFKRDPIDQTKQVCETHLPPVYRPRIILQDGSTYPYNLHTLDNLIQNPQEGHRAQFDWNPAIQQYCMIQAGAACWMVMRKGVLAKGQGLEQIQVIRPLNVGYEEVSSAIDLATVILTHHVVTGKRYLGDPTGEEQGMTTGLVKETYRGVMMSDPPQYTAPMPLGVGPFTRQSLSFYGSGTRAEFFGIVALKKF